MVCTPVNVPRNSPPQQPLTGANTIDPATNLYASPASLPRFTYEINI